MPDALLLSPDDQAVNAITGVLEEMSVSCERPLDGVSAAQKLSSHNYDLVLVDCENLPAAKLIFDVCRRGKNGHNPIPIAIVDGRAGLPTAFRLGAELILTKPVAKDQARSTIRTAVGRIRKDVVASEPVTPPTVVSTPAPSDATPVQTVSAAAAGAASSPLASFAESLGKAVPSATASRSASAAAVSTAPLPTHAVEAAPADSKPSPARVPLSSLLASAATSAAATPPKPSAPTQFSDDPVLAELEMAELEEAATIEPSEPEPAKAATKSSPKESAAPSSTPVFSSYSGRQKPRGALVALLVLAIASAGFYAAWTYDPGFRTIFQAVAQPQIDRALVLAGMPPASSSSSAKPATPAVPRPVPAPAPTTQVASDSTATTTASPDTTTTPAATTAAAPASSAAISPAKAIATPSVAVPTAAINTIAPTVSKPEPARARNTATTASAAASQAPLPGEGTAVILSSKGAEKRLAHSVAPKYPADAHAGAEGTVVLKEVVDETGKVAGVRLVEGDATLATAAMQAVKQWRYRPYVRDGKIEPFQTVVILDFQKP
jgi:TonB family protein